MKSTALQEKDYYSETFEVYFSPALSQFFLFKVCIFMNLVFSDYKQFFTQKINCFLTPNKYFNLLLKSPISWIA